VQYIYGILKIFYYYRVVAKSRKHATDQNVFLAVWDCLKNNRQEFRRFFQVFVFIDIFMGVDARGRLPGGGGRVLLFWFQIKCVKSRTKINSAGLCCTPDAPIWCFIRRSKL
jgi:hypothetical protein